MTDDEKEMRGKEAFFKFLSNHELNFPTWELLTRMMKGLYPDGGYEPEGIGKKKNEIYFKVQNIYDESKIDAIMKYIEEVK